MSCIMRGATIVPHAVFDVPAVLARVAEEGITVLPGPPTLLQGILNFPDRDKFDLSTLRLTVTGAAAVPVELIKRLRNEMTFETIITGYGLTETTGTATMCRHDDDPETIANWSGRAIPDTEVRIVDDDGNELPPMKPGEVVIRGYNVMRGYFDEPEETAVDHRRRRAGCTPATSGSWTSAATCGSPTARRTCSSSAGSTPTRRRSRTSSCATRRSARSRSSASPTSGWARWAWPSSSPAPASPSSPTS